MVSYPDGLRPSSNKAFSDSQHTYPIPDFSNESFLPDSRQASPTSKEKDLSDWSSRLSSEQSSPELLATSETSAQQLKKLGLPQLEIVAEPVDFMAALPEIDELNADEENDKPATETENTASQTGVAPIVCESKDTNIEKESADVKPTDVTQDKEPAKLTTDVVKYPSGAQLGLTWDGDNIDSIELSGTNWKHVQEDGKYIDQWRNPSGATWKGKMHFDRATNEFRMSDPEHGRWEVIIRASGDRESVAADGSRTIDFVNKDQVIYNKDNLMTSFRTPDGVTRTFSDFKSFNLANDMVPTKIRVDSPATTTALAGVTNYSMNPDQSWTCEGHPYRHDVFTVDSKNGTYGFEDLNTGVVKTWVPGKYIEVTETEGAETYQKRDHADGSKSVSRWDEKWTVNLSDDLATRFEIDGKVREIKRDEKGSVTTLSDTVSNREWLKNDRGEWTAKPIDPSKPFSPPAVSSFSGQLFVDARGLTLVKTADASFKVLDMDGTLRQSSKSEHLRGLAITANSIHRPGQVRFAESINNFMERSGLSAEEKDKTIDQITRLMQDTTGGPFSGDDQRTMAAQMSWHLARPYRQEQGQNNTCNVTAVRDSIIVESPSYFAKMIADVGTTGQFITADGSTIKPTVEGMNYNIANLKFPPGSGDRTWLGQIADHTMINIYWQRQTVDTYGQIVNKGDLIYVQRPGTGDSGERIERRQNGILQYLLRNKLDANTATCPCLGHDNLADVYGQITGRNEAERVIGSKLVPQKIDAIQVTSLAEFEAQMQKGPWPKIVMVHTSRDPFYADSGYGTAGGAGGRMGGWHVVVARNYDPKGRRVSVDNSWSTAVDHVSPYRHIPVKQLYESTIGPVK